MRKRGAIFITLDAEEAVVVKAALGALARQIHGISDSDALRDLSEISTELHARIAKRFNACAKSVERHNG